MSDNRSGEKKTYRASVFGRHRRRCGAVIYHLLTDEVGPAIGVMLGAILSASFTAKVISQLNRK